MHPWMRIRGFIFSTLTIVQGSVTKYVHSVMKAKIHYSLQSKIVYDKTYKE